MLVVTCFQIGRGPDSESVLTMLVGPNLKIGFLSRMTCQGSCVKRCKDWRADAIVSVWHTDICRCEIECKNAMNSAITNICCALEKSLGGLQQR